MDNVLCILYICVLSSVFVYHIIYLFIFKTATTAEIRRAYRKRSKEVHPDRNKAENAADMFRQVLKTNLFQEKN